MENCIENRSSRVSPHLQNLPSDTVAMIKLPVSIRRMTALCEMFRDPGHRIHQDGEWIVVTKGGRP